MLRLRGIGAALLSLIVAAVLTGCRPVILRVTSQPAGAQVFFNGQSVGVTPCAFQVANPGTVLVKLDGYKDAARSVQATEGTEYELHFTMEKLAPATFIQTMEPTWATVEIRDGMTYPEAWNALVDLLVKKFDLEILAKEDGYCRSTWLYSWTGELRDDYRVRVTLKFSSDRSKVEVKSEANYRVGNNWVQGSDTSLLQTLKTDIMGTVGRVTR